MVPDPTRWRQRNAIAKPSQRSVVVRQMAAEKMVLTHIARPMFVAKDLDTSYEVDDFSCRNISRSRLPSGQPSLIGRQISVMRLSVRTTDKKVDEERVEVVQV
jgi:hypothetical protein